MKLQTTIDSRIKNKEQIKALVQTKNGVEKEFQSAIEHFLVGDDKACREKLRNIIHASIGFTDFAVAIYKDRLGSGQRPTKRGIRSSYVSLYNTLGRRCRSDKLAQIIRVLWTLLKLDYQVRFFRR